MLLDLLNATVATQACALCVCVDRKMGQVLPFDYSYEQCCVYAVHTERSVYATL